MRSKRWMSGAFGLVVLVLGCCLPAESGAVLVDDAQVKALAGVQSFKLLFSYGSDAAYEAARTAACARQGVACPAMAEGALYYRTADNVLRYYDGAAWATYAPGLGGGATLDDVYGAGQTITKDAGAVTVNDPAVDASTTLNLHKTAGTGVVLNIDNAGTGNDITGDAWAVDTNGIIAATGLFMSDDAPVRLGAASDINIEWDTLPGIDGLAFVPAADSTPVYWGSDQHGMDQFWYADSGAGVLCQFDASGALFNCDGISFYYDDNSALVFGTGNDFSLGYDGTSLNLVGGTAGDDFRIGEDGLGHDTLFYGSIAGQQCAFDYNNATSGDALVCDGYDIWLKDADILEFGDSLDWQITFDGTRLNMDGPTGNELRIGADGVGQDVVFYGSIAGQKCVWDSANGLSGDALVCDGADILLKDDDRLLFGDGIEMSVVWNNASSKLFADTNGNSDYPFQIGTSVANHLINLNVGDPAVAAVQVTASATDPELNYVGAKPVRTVFIPASAFGTSAGAWTRGTQAGSSFGGQYATLDATDDALEYYWQPPAWVDGTAAITGRIVFANSVGGCVTGLEFNHAKFDMQSAAGSRSQLDVLTKTGTELDTTTPANTWEVAKTANFTIPAAAVDEDGRYPIYLEIYADGNDAQQTCANADTILGIELDVTQAEIAE